MSERNDSTDREIDAAIEDLIAAASPGGDLGGNGTLALGRLRAGIRAAVAAEREACAQVAEAFGAGPAELAHPCDIAAAIRARWQVSAAEDAALPVVIVYNPHPVDVRTILVDEYGRVVRSPEVDAEIAALRARVAELEAAIFPLPCGHPQYYIDDGSGRGGPRVDSCAWCALNDEVADGDRVAEKLRAVQEAARRYALASSVRPWRDRVLSAALATIDAPPSAMVPEALEPDSFPGALVALLTAAKAARGAALPGWRAEHEASILGAAYAMLDALGDVPRSVLDDGTATAVDAMRRGGVL